MRTKLFKFAFIVGLAILVSSCAREETPTDSLKGALDGKFLIGTALNSIQIYGDDSAATEIIVRNFNSIVAENCMKSEIIQPEEGVFDFRQSDAMVDFGVAYDMYIVGHCLIWHSQAPDWLFMDAGGKYVSREVLIERMKTHITTLVERYKGRVDAWIVVNEAFLDDGSWRNSRFYDIIGPAYIELAFQFAHEADPKAELLYNDNSMFHEGKRNSVVELVNDLKSKGIRIDGVGMQAHSGLDSIPPLDEFEKSIEAFDAAGVDVHVTELDITVIPLLSRDIGAEVSADFKYWEMMDPYPNGLPDSVSIALHDRYMEFFDLFLRQHDKIKRVTVWGLTDDQSWRNYWPIQGRTDYPLLYDRNYDAKPVVADIIKAAQSLEE